MLQEHEDGTGEHEDGTGKHEDGTDYYLGMNSV